MSVSDLLCTSSLYFHCTSTYTPVPQYRERRLHYWKSYEEKSPAALKATSRPPQGFVAQCARAHLQRLFPNHQALYPSSPHVLD